MTIILPKYTGPGPQTLIGQYTDPKNPKRQHGFFGEIPSSEFISGDRLASAISLTAGTSQNSDIPWLKFYIDGKIVYVPKKTIRHNVSWEDIYQAGAMYGDGATGLHLEGTARVQDAKVTIEADIFKVNLISGANSNPCPNVSGYDVPASHGSEWNRLFYNICIADYSGGQKASQEGDQWANYTDDDLGIDYRTNNGSYSWCIEQHAYGVTYRVFRGYGGISLLSKATVIIATANIGWRPRLELVL